MIVIATVREHALVWPRYSRRFGRRLIIGVCAATAMVAGCKPDMRSEEERIAAAARADSSAAGYDVGVPDSGGSSVRGTGAPPQRGRGSGSGSTTPGAATDPAAPSTALPSPRATQPGRLPIAVPVDSTGDAVQSGRRGQPPGPMRLPPVREADFLSYDTAARTLDFHLTAGSEIPDRVSFNGSLQGMRVLTVPAGWTVTVRFANHDAVLPHSATVVPGTEVIEEDLPPPAFPEAATVRVREGLLDGDGDEFTFLADRAGRYLLACGVFGHAQRGQWVSLVVRTGIPVPSYR